MKIIWRKREFEEFIRLRRCALTWRRVNEMPAYLQPIGFGLSMVRPIREGFWLEKSTGDVYIGFLRGFGNFHYVSATGLMRSDVNWPEPLQPLSFQEGYQLFQASRATVTGDVVECRRVRV